MHQRPNGYFTLTLDYSQVDVAFQYEISVTSATNSVVTDLVATKYSTDNGVSFTNLNSLGTISRTVNLNDSHSPITYRVYVKWDDDPATQTMNNLDDAASANASDSTAKVKVDVSFTQIAA